MKIKLYEVLEEMGDSSYSFLPKNKKEVNNLVKDKMISNKIIKLLETLQKVNSSIEDPLAIKKDNFKQIKIARKLKDKESELLNKLGIKSLDELAPLKISFGNGSRGLKGSNSRGFSFEKEVLNDLIKYSNGSLDFEHPKLIEDIKKIIKPTDIKEVSLEGSKNTKRPLKISGGNLLISSSTSGFDIGKEVADILVKTKSGEELYFSLKYKSSKSSAISFFNIGLTKFLKKEEIEKFKIENKESKAILNFFGIDEKRFCSIYNGFNNKNIPIDEKFKKKEIIESKADKSKIQSLLRSGIGYGYYVIYQAGKDYEVENIDKKYLDSITKVQSVKIIYPEIGKSKYLQIIIQTSKYKFNVHIRNSQGGIYPNGMFCYYSGK